MEWKQVYSQVVGCAYGNTVNNTLSCESCDMRLVAGNSKIYVPADQPVPIDAQINKKEGIAGEDVVVTISFDGPVKSADVETILGSQLELVSVVAGEGEEGETVTVTARAKENAVPGRYNIITTYKSVARIFDFVINQSPAAPEVEMELESISLDKDTLEVGETTKATLGFQPKV